MKAIATEFTDENVASAVKHIFPQPEISRLDLAEGKELGCEFSSSL
jgi:hypothetical protein